jgi:hypothetical protein
MSYYFMAWFRKRKGPLKEAETLIRKHKKRFSLPKGETIKVARLLREIKSLNISEAQKLKLEAELLLILKAHEAATHDFFAFQEWARSKNNGKMPTGFKKFRMEIEWVFDKK